MLPYVQETPNANTLAIIHEVWIFPFLLWGPFSLDCMGDMVSNQVNPYFLQRVWELIAGRVAM